MKVLVDVLPEKTRKITYAAYAVMGVVLGGSQVGFAAAELAQPVWLTVALAVYAFVGGAVGLVAESNTAVHDEDLSSGEADRES